MESWIFNYATSSKLRVAGWRLAIQSVLAALGVVVVDELFDRCPSSS